MGGRSLGNDGRTAFAGEADISFSFLLNGTSAIVIAPPAPPAPTATPAAIAAAINYRGGGLLPGGSVVYQASTGIYLVTLGQGHNYRYVVLKSADLDDTVNDGAYATIGSMQNEGTPNPLAFTLYTRAAAGTLTNYTNRRVQILLTVKQSGSGS